MGKTLRISIFKRFFSSTSSSGFIVLICLLVSLILANSPLAKKFEALLSTSVGLQSATVNLHYTVQSWINDGFMAIFFLLVGLEIKRELLHGELSSLKKALLPILCATGGAIVPALIYFIFNKGLPSQQGWGIPMATDIAFALAIMGMLSKKVPASLRIFLAALAIVDDLMAILVIAFFYSTGLHLDYLLYAFGVIVLMFILNRLKVNKLLFYLVPGMLLWYFIHHSGIHATIAGVLTAICIPATDGDRSSPLARLEHFLLKPVNFIIVPIFALANTNITFSNEMIKGVTTPLGVGITIGLIVGKPVGVLLASFSSVSLGLTQLPANANWRHIVGIGLLAGIGFTMSIFLSLLSFTDSALISQAKFSVLCGSFVSASLGYLFLSRKGRQGQH